jgi:transposase
MVMADYDWYVGIDWGSERHQVVILDATGRRVAEYQVAHSGAGLDSLVAQLAKLGAEAGRVAVAIEVPRGAVVETLLAQGYPVFALNPKQLDRFRGRYTVAGAKDDRRDALVAASALRTDRPAFRALQPDEPEIIRVRELSRTYEELVGEERRLANQLREQLWRYFPQALAHCPGADEPWLWEVLQEAPTPRQAQRLTRAALRARLARHRLRRLTGDELYEALQARSVTRLPGAEEAAAEHVELLLPRLQLVHEQRQRCERRLETLLDALSRPSEGRQEHRDVTILRSLPGVGKVVAGTMLAEAWSLLATRDYQSLRAQSGVAPITKQSGKQRVVLMRRSCNYRLRTALFHWARNSVQVDPRCRAQYQRLRQRHGPARALRSVANSLLAMLIAMLRSGTIYDATRRVRAA